MGSWSYQRDVFYRVAVRCPKCGRRLGQWERQVDYVTHPGWKAVDEGRFRPPPGDRNADRKGTNWSLQCRKRDRHGRLCTFGVSIRADRLVPALDSAQECGRHDLDAGWEL